MQTQSNKSLELVVGIGGSLEASLVPYHLTYLKSHYDIDIKVAITKSAKQFVSVKSLKAISNNQVYFKNQQYDNDMKPLHLTYSNADVFLVYPATGRLIAEFALGIISCPVTRLFSFFNKPDIIIGPFIHTQMTKDIYTPHFNALKELGCMFSDQSYQTSFSSIKSYFDSNFHSYSKSPVSNILNFKK